MDNYIIAFLIFLGIVAIFAFLKFVLDQITEALDKEYDIDYNRTSPPEDSNFH